MSEKEDTLEFESFEICVNDGQVQDDICTLILYEDLIKDKDRLAAAKKQAVIIAEEQTEIVKILTEIAK